MLLQAARIVNSTPLHKAPESPNDSQPITPHHLITQRYNEADLIAYGANRWKRIEALSDEFAMYWKHYILQIGTTKKNGLPRQEMPQSGRLSYSKRNRCPRHASTGTQAPLSQRQWTKTIWCERSWCSHIRNQAIRYAPYQKNVPFMIWFSSKPSRPRTTQHQTRPLRLMPRRKPVSSYPLFWKMTQNSLEFSQKNANLMP